MKKFLNFNLLMLILLIVCMFAMFGCASTGSGGLDDIKLPDACDTIEGPSKLCELAAEQNVNLSVVADGLGLLNIIAIEKGLYTKDQALGALIDLRGFVEMPVSYAAFRTEITDTISAYPYLLQTADRYVNALVSNQIMYSEDQRLIAGWLERLIIDLAPD